MLWKEIRTWAKSKGYETIKDKEDGQYYWAKLDSNDPESSGVAKSVSKLATQIYNHMTNNQWVEYQKEYQEKFNPKIVQSTDYNNH
jgi:hypothetical protein